MTVKQLMEILDKYPEDAEVLNEYGEIIYYARHEKDEDFVILSPYNEE